MNTDHLLTEKELAAILGISHWTVRKMRLQDGLPFIQTGSRIYYRLEKVNSWMTQQEETNAKNHTLPKARPMKYTW